MFSSTSKFSSEHCCICGLESCTQSLDHKKVTHPQLTKSLQNLISKNQTIPTLKGQIKKFFKEIKNAFLQALNMHESMVQQSINRLYFNRDIEQKINVFFLSELIEQNWRHLPNKIVRKISKLSRDCGGGCSEYEGLEEVFENIRVGMNNVEVGKLFQTFAQILQPLHGSSHIPQKAPSLKKLSSFQENFDKITTYEWKRIKITKNTSHLEMNSRNITDEQLMLTMPKLTHFTNLKQFQIRNNKITNIGCCVIGNYMKNLKLIDLRNNKGIGDQGVEKIVSTLQGLKSLLISDTNVGERTAVAIVNGVSLLEMLWSQNTKFSGEVAVQIAKKPQLKVLSLIGNDISLQYCKNLREIFSMKGYLNI